MTQINAEKKGDELHLTSTAPTLNGQPDSNGTINIGGGGLFGGH